MLQLTSRAADHLVQIRRERGVDERASARLVQKEKGVSLTFVMAPRDGDLLAQDTGVRLYVAPEVADTLEQATIDVREEEGKSMLVLRRAAKASPTGTSG
jgi:Fe-S cluster assembly iron-binding protein IscA